MRNIFLFLLACNLITGLWIGMQPEKTTWPKVPTVKPERQLKLLRETQEPKVSTVSDTENADTSEHLLPEVDFEEGTSCYTIGPFKVIDQAKAVRQRLQDLSLKARQRQKQEKEQYGYRVYIPPLDSREQAIEVAKTLAENDIRDYFIINDADKNNALAIGLFRNKNGAIRRMAQVRNLGFKTAMEARYREQTIYWLDYSQVGEVVTPEVWREIAEMAPDLQQLLRDCP